MEMLDLAQSVFGGAWRIDTWSDGRIQLVRTDADKEAQHSAIFTEALNICRLRSVMHCSNRALRDNVDRTVRWDCFQGVWNWLGECGMSRKTWTHMFSSYGPDAQPAAASDADDPTQPDYLQRSITNAVEFFMQAKYLDIVDVLRVREQGQTRNFNGVPVATHKLLSAMFEHTATMLKVAYNPKPSATDIVNVSQAASNLRKILHALQAKGTVWGHVWTCHVPQFLTRWGTLYPFLCMVWRAGGDPLRLKGARRSQTLALHKLNRHGQWKGAKVGFAQVLVYGVVAWALVRLGIKLVGRTTSVTKTKTALFDDFCNRMQDVREGKCTHPIVR